MKKLLAAGCVVLAFQNFSQVAPANDALGLQSGRRVLVKALAVFMNAEGHRKLPPKRISLPNLESPRP